MNQREIQVNPWWTLAVLCLCLVMVVVGNTVLNVALPTLVRDLGATSSQLQWMVDSYALVFAGLLLTGGALGDRFGRKGALSLNPASSLSVAPISERRWSTGPRAGSQPPGARCRLGTWPALCCGLRWVWS